jgi:hypothetical protein
MSRFFVEQTGERIVCLLNPESVVMRREAGICPRRSIGGGLTGAEPAELSEDERLLLLEREQSRRSL